MRCTVVHIVYRLSQFVCCQFLQFSVKHICLCCWHVCFYHVYICISLCSVLKPALNISQWLTGMLSDAPSVLWNVSVSYSASCTLSNALCKKHISHLQGLSVTLYWIRFELDLLLTLLSPAGYSPLFFAVLNIFLFHTCCYSFQPWIQMLAELLAEGFSLKAWE